MRTKHLVERTLKHNASTAIKRAADEDFGDS